MIIFIDDEIERISSFIEFIRDEGYDVTEVNNLREATYIIKGNSERIELIILDIMMPPENFYDPEYDPTGIFGGLTFYEKIIKNYGEIPVIIFSNITDLPIKNRILNNPLTVFIQKRRTLPFNLVDVINDILNSSSKDIS